MTPGDDQLLKLKATWLIAQQVADAAYVQHLSASRRAEIALPGCGGLTNRSRNRAGYEGLGLGISDSFCKNNKVSTKCINFKSRY